MYGLKKFFEQTKLWLLKKYPIFFILTDSKSIKIQKVKFETKVCS